MLGIGFYKLILVIIVALILFKPKDLSKILYNIGKIIKKINNFQNKMKNEVENIVILGNPEDYIITDKNEIKNNPLNEKDK